MSHKISFFIIVSFLFIGCAEKQTLNMDVKPKYQVQKKIDLPSSNRGSLYTRKGASLFADKKDLQIGDIIKVNVLIDESTTTNVERNSFSDKSKNNSLGAFTSTNNSNTAKKLNSALGLGFNIENTAKADADADSTTLDDLESTISAVIEEVYQNGNYFIKGNRNSLIQGQKLVVKISGVIRPYDINPQDNSIGSEKIANFKVLYEKNGEEVDIIKKKWGTRLIDAIWPF